MLGALAGSTSIALVRRMGVFFGLVNMFGPVDPDFGARHGTRAFARFLLYARSCFLESHFRLVLGSKFLVTLPSAGVKGMPLLYN